ncbi:MAG: hypothetical protein AB2L07_20040 [Thermoanaerobaculaceae bacterium]
MIPITSTATKTSSSTPSSTDSGASCERAMPNVTMPFSSTRYPSTWVIALRRATMRNIPVSVVNSATGTRRRDAAGTGSVRREDTHTVSASIASPSSTDGVYATYGSISRRISAPRSAFHSRRGNTTPLSSTLPPASSTARAGDHPTWTRSASTPSSTPCTATRRMHVTSRLAPSSRRLTSTSITRIGSISQPTLTSPAARPAPP